MPDTTPQEASTDIESAEVSEDCQLASKAIELLKQQLVKATEDLEHLKKLKVEALSDPFEFIQNLKQSKTKVPKLQKVIAAPDIEWSKYKYIPESRIASVHSFAQHLISNTTYKSILDTPIEIQHTSSTSNTTKYLQQELSKATQAIHQIPSRTVSLSDFSDDGNEEDTGDLAMKTTPKSTLSYKGKGRKTSAIQPGAEMQRASEKKYKLQSIEPRTPDDASSMDSGDDKIPTFKLPWSDEEQQRLQDLLEIYPDEPIQAQRFSKISKALGTRTQKQVASRVQKYFIKLARMGLPVPGRITIPSPHTPKEKTTHRSKPKAGRVTKPAASLRTSGAGYNSVISGGITTSRISGAHYATSVGPPSAFMSDEEEDSSVNEMMRQSMVNKTDKDLSSSDLVIHEGYACDGCGTEPIVGVLYRCTVCDISEEVDLCGNCMEKGTFTNDHHTVDHTFEAVRTATQFPYYADNDYKSPGHLGEYSYLGI
ncbi:hypothetical protein BY458DRAFT_496380 [Sporodiniella umbellata]|nr:hypothetical protein BY458DRAFT_496380 [Sporodiniella umbellata]